MDDIGCTATLRNIIWDTTDENGVDQRATIDPEDIPDEMYVDFTGYSDETEEELEERAIEEATGDWLIISADVAVKTHD